MFLAKATQYHKDVNYLQNELWIQCNSNKNPTEYFLEMGKLVLTFIWKIKCQMQTKYSWLKKKKNKVGYSLYSILSHSIKL